MTFHELREENWWNVVHQNSALSPLQKLWSLTENSKSSNGVGTIWRSFRAHSAFVNRVALNPHGKRSSSRSYTSHAITFTKVQRDEFNNPFELFRSKLGVPGPNNKLFDDLLMPLLLVINTTTVNDVNVFSSWSIFHIELKLCPLGLQYETNLKLDSAL